MMTEMEKKQMEKRAAFWKGGGNLLRRAMSLRRNVDDFFTLTLGIIIELLMILWYASL